MVAGAIRECGGDLKNFSVLEVGPSHGQVTNYLRKFGVQITTIDTKPEYTPDVVGSVFAMPFADNSFDMIVVCEVLEHYPFADFQKALAELKRVTRKTVLLSMPDARRILCGISFKPPFLKEVRFAVRIPTFTRHVPDLPGGHHWEIGKRGYPPSRVRRVIEKAGFRVVNEQVLYDTPKNHYFLVEKLSN